MWFCLKILRHEPVFIFAPIGSCNRGDYRTGKRLNMRKIIPYIASQFRKDRIWLRRTKPSKRQYQICLAIDDSSSMVDNHTKQVRGEAAGSGPRAGSVELAGRIDGSIQKGGLTLHVMAFLKLVSRGCWVFFFFLQWFLFGISQQLTSPGRG